MTLQGVIVAFRVVDGSLRKGDTVRLMNTKKEYQVDEVGVRAPSPIEVRQLHSKSSLQWVCYTNGLLLAC